MMIALDFHRSTTSSLHNSSYGGDNRMIVSQHWLS